MYALLADLMVGIHVAIVSFALFGQIAILIGLVCRWQWIRNPWFRWIHVGLICVVAVESIFNITCPLTTWEDSLRGLAGQRRHLDWAPDLVTSIAGNAAGLQAGGPWVAAYMVKYGRPSEEKSFVGRMLRDFLFFEIPEWVFTVIYISFAAVVLLTFWLAPPRSFRSRRPCSEPAPAAEPGRAHVAERTSVAESFPG
jgi:hypothetical protein